MAEPKPRLLFYDNGLGAMIVEAICLCGWRAASSSVSVLTLAWHVHIAIQHTIFYIDDDENADWLHQRRS